MKKLIVCIWAVLSITCFGACSNSVEDKAKDYAGEIMKASSDKEYVKVTSLTVEIAKYRESLSDEEKEKFDAAFQEAISNLADVYDSPATDFVSGIIGSAELMDSEDNNIDEEIEDYEESLDEASEDMNEFMDKASKDLDESMEKAAEDLEKSVDNAAKDLEKSMMKGLGL